MGRDFAEAYAASGQIFDQADQILGRSISKLCFEGSEENLRQTVNTQPALYVTSAAILAAMRSEGIDGSMAAGHSLGEYTALYAAGALDFETGLRLVDVRARAMEEAGRKMPGTMAALIGLEPEKIAKACQEASTVGIVGPANWNSQQQAVISGQPEAVDRAIELAKEAGCKKAIKLNVGGAFHSPLMLPAVDPLHAALCDAKINSPNLKFVANVNAKFLSDPEAIRASLEDQILKCVDWVDTILAMAQAGANYFIEVGTGGVLTGLNKRIDKSLNSLSLSTVQELKNLCEAKLS